MWGSVSSHLYISFRPFEMLRQAIHNELLEYYVKVVMSDVSAVSRHLCLHCSRLPSIMYSDE